MKAKIVELPPQVPALKRKEILSEVEREYELLVFLENNEGLNIIQISMRLGWTPEQVSYYASMLETKDLVRVRDEIESHEKIICINRESGIFDMLNMDEIDPRLLEDLDI